MLSVLLLGICVKQEAHVDHCIPIHSGLFFLFLQLCFLLLISHVLTFLDNSLTKLFDQVFANFIFLKDLDEFYQIYFDI